MILIRLSFIVLYVCLVLLYSCDQPANNKVSFEQKRSYKWMFHDSIKDSINQTPGNYSNDNLLYRSFQYQNDFSKFDPGYVIDVLELKNNAAALKGVSFTLTTDQEFEFSGGLQGFDRRSDNELQVSNSMKNLKSLQVVGRIQTDTIFDTDYYKGLFGNSSLIYMLDSNSELKIKLFNRSKNDKIGLFFCEKGKNLFIIKFTSEKPFDEKLFALIDWEKFDKISQ